MSEELGRRAGLERAALPALPPKRHPIRRGSPDVTCETAFSEAFSAEWGVQLTYLDLDLVVHAAEMFEFSVIAPPAKVPGVEHEAPAASKLMLACCAAPR